MTTINEAGAQMEAACAQFTAAMARLTPLFVRLARAVNRVYALAPREMKIAVNDRRATPVALKKIRRYLRGRSQ